MSTLRIKTELNFRIKSTLGGTIKLRKELFNSACSIFSLSLLIEGRKYVIVSDYFSYSPGLFIVGLILLLEQIVPSSVSSPLKRELAIVLQAASVATLS